MYCCTMAPPVHLAPVCRHAHERYIATKNENVVHSQAMQSGQVAGTSPPVAGTIDGISGAYTRAHKRACMHSCTRVCACACVHVCVRVHSTKRDDPVGVAMIAPTGLGFRAARYVLLYVLHVCRHRCLARSCRAYHISVMIVYIMTIMMDQSPLAFSDSN